MKVSGLKSTYDMLMHACAQALSMDRVFDAETGATISPVLEAYFGTRVGEKLHLSREKLLRVCGMALMTSFRIGNTVSPTVMTFICIQLSESGQMTRKEIIRFLRSCIQQFAPPHEQWSLDWQPGGQPYVFNSRHAQYTRTLARCVADDIAAEEAARPDDRLAALAALEAGMEVRNRPH